MVSGGNRLQPSSRALPPVAQRPASAVPGIGRPNWPPQQKPQKQTHKLSKPGQWTDSGWVRIKRSDYREEVQNPYRSASTSELSRPGSRQSTIQRPSTSSRALQSTSGFTCSSGVLLEMPAAARREVPALYAPRKAFEYQPRQSASRSRSSCRASPERSKPSRLSSNGDFSGSLREFNSTALSAAPELRAALNQDALKPPASAAAGGSASSTATLKVSLDATDIGTVPWQYVARPQSRQAQVPDGRPASRGQRRRLLKPQPSMPDLPTEKADAELVLSPKRPSLPAAFPEEAPSKTFLDELVNPKQEFAVISVPSTAAPPEAEDPEDAQDRRCICGNLVPPGDKFCGQCGTKYIRPAPNTDSMAEFSTDLLQLSQFDQDDDENAGVGAQLARFESRVQDLRRRQQATRQRLAPLLVPGPSQRFVKAMAQARDQMAEILQSATQEVACLDEIDEEQKDLSVQTGDLDDTDAALRALLKRMTDKVDHMSEYLGA